MIKWNEKEVLSKISKATQAASKEVANNFVADLKRNLSKVGGGGSIGGRIQKRKSKFKDGGYIAGVFCDDAGKFGKGNWENSDEGKLHFFEYGRSAPGKGRKHGGPQSVNERAQPPRSFIRPAKKKNQRKAKGIFLKHLT